MTVTTVGVGLGDRELAERPNLMRLIVGERLGTGETLVQLEAAIDDMPGEHYDFLLDRLHAAGALEVLILPAQMKKNRPAALVRVLARESEALAVQTAFFNYSTTLGVRGYEVRRTALKRNEDVVKTRYGLVRVKRAARPDGSERVHVEYDDLKTAAERAGTSLAKVEAEVLAQWQKRKEK
jgi:uncharacterized protein (DUF111 family)